jgi:hypothetical protein
MIRSVCIFILVSVVFVSCASDPAPSGAGLARYGAGSVEEGDSAPRKASAPAQRLRQSEIQARVAALESDMDAKIAAFDLSGAFDDLNEIAALLPENQAGKTRLQEVLRKIEPVVDSILVEAASVPPETAPDVAFKKPFSVRVSLKTPEGKRPLSGFRLAVSYPSIAEDGTRSIATASVLSDATGLASFVAPVPPSTGLSRVLFAADFASDDPLLAKAVESRRAALSVSCEHRVGPREKRAPTTISILDYDKNGKPVLGGNPTATTLLKPLVQKGLTRIGMADFPHQLASGDEAALIKAAKAQFQGGVQRFIYGTGRIERLERGDDGVWRCTFVVQASVWDFAADRKAFSTEIRYEAEGPTEAAALDAARKKVAGELLVNELYYNL